MVALAVVPGVGLSAVKAAILPVPLAASPIVVFVLVQLNVAPVLPAKFTAFVVAFAQSD